MKLTQFLTNFGDIYDHPISLANLDLNDYPLTYVNLEFQKMCHYPTSEIIGKNCRFLQGELTDPESTSRIKAHLLQRSAICQDLVNYTKDGSVFYNRIVLIPFKENNTNHCLGLQHVITQDSFKHIHNIDRLELLDKLVNPITVLMSYLEVSNLKQESISPEDLKSRYKDTINRIRQYILGL